ELDAEALAAAGGREPERRPVRRHVPLRVALRRGRRLHVRGGAARAPRTLRLRPLDGGLRAAAALGRRLARLALLDLVPQGELLRGRRVLLRHRRAERRADRAAADLTRVRAASARVVRMRVTNRLPPQTAAAMKALAVYPGRPGSLHLEELPEPTLDEIPGGRDRRRVPSLRLLSAVAAGSL